MASETKTAADYLDALRRRKWKSFGIGSALFVISLAAAVLWPPTYKSTATILIEQQAIPEDLVRSTVTSYADQRIQTISQRVMTRANLLDIIHKYGLYAKEMQDKPVETVVDKMRDDVHLEMVSADVVDPRTGRPTQATIAFKLSYENRSPILAQKVANELTSLYLDENLKRRTELADETSDFMRNEADRLAAKISLLEAKLANFKEKNAGMLPDLKQVNLQVRDGTEASLQDLDRHMRDLNDRIIFLTSELGQAAKAVAPADPDQVTDPVARLNLLKTQLVSKQAIYGPDHPTIVRMRREIQALQTDLGISGDSVPVLKQRLESLQAQLRSDEGSYSAQHPEVVRLKKAIAALRKELDAATNDVADSALAGDSDNPTYIQVRTQLQSARAELKSVETNRAQLKKKLDRYEDYLAGMPEVERRYRAMTRDYENAVAQYRDIKAKQMDAQMAQALESERKGERFTLIDPPQLPEEPVKPQRWAIAVAGLVFSLGGGVGTGLMLEHLDPRVNGLRGVERLGVPLLGAVPYIQTVRDRIRRRRVWMSVGLGTVTMVSLILVLVHLFYMPLDVLWFSVARRLGA